MSALKDRINEDVKAALRAHEKDRLATLRLINASIKQREVDQRVPLDDVQVMAVLDKMAKQHRDSIAQFGKAGRQDLVEKEQFELAIVLSYLPKPLDAAEIESMIGAAIDATGAASIKDMRKVMGQLKPTLQGRADMAQVSGLVKARLSS